MARKITRKYGKKSVKNIRYFFIFQQIIRLVDLSEKKLESEKKIQILMKNLQIYNLQRKNSFNILKKIFIALVQDKKNNKEYYL